MKSVEPFKMLRVVYHAYPRVSHILALTVIELAGPLPPGHSWAHRVLQDDPEYVELTIRANSDSHASELGDILMDVEQTIHDMANVERIIFR